MRQTKEETIFKLLEVALALDFKRGHMRWSMSDLARASGMTRSLIYYYFGKDKSTVLLEAVTLIGEELMGLSPSRMKLWNDNNIVESMKRSRSFMDRSPHVAGFYFSNRIREGLIGEAIRKLERRLHKKLVTLYPDRSETQIHRLIALLVGSSFAPFVRLSDLEDGAWLDI